jgi:L-ascorbate metabolism protein UlaG (beta-lactamase superfamily)
MAAKTAGGGKREMDKLLEGITWLGHASFKIKAAEGVIYIDPWKLKSDEPADLILITHDHHDHLSPDDVAKISKPGTVVVTIAAAAAKLKGDVRVVKPGDKLTVKGVAIEVVPAYNPKKQFHPRAQGHVGYVLTMGGRRIYHAGDTDVIPEMAHIKTDVALLPAGGKFTMDAHEAAQAANLIQPKLAVPMHWGDLIGSQADADTFRAESKVPVEILEPKDQ